MSFIQPFLLYLLPLAALPIIVHLINKRRHKTIQWAAMQFLISATRQSRGKRRLRYFLILTCRVLALLCFLLALARPLAGGWLGMASGGAPDTVILLFDRSASMETSTSASGGISKRENALDRLSGALDEFAATARIVLIDSTSNQSFELDSASVLTELPQTQPSDAAADVPRMFISALDYIASSNPGNTEIWVASDLQYTSWQADDDQWTTIRNTLQQLQNPPPIRILALTEQPGNAWAIHLTSATQDHGGIALEFNLAQSRATETTLPLTLTLDGAGSVQEQITFSEPNLSLHKRIPLTDRTDEHGYGKLSIPPDSTPADNDIWFLYGPEQDLQVAVVSDSPVRRVLELAGAPPAATNRRPTVFNRDEIDLIDPEEVPLILWQGTLPDDEQAPLITDFIEQGGSVLFFPPEQRLDAATNQSFLGIRWSASEDAPEDERFQISHWERNSGPLRNFDGGQPMAVDRLYVIRRVVPVGEFTTLAEYIDETPAISRLSAGRGQAIFFSTLPDPHWSDLGRYNVFLPMVERLIADATRHLGPSRYFDAGDVLPTIAGSTNWNAIDELTPSPLEGEPVARAGIYRNGEIFAAVNTPHSESDPRQVNRDTLNSMFDGLSMRLFEERVVRESSLASEIWRLFAIAVLFFLLSEALLCLPPRASSQETAATPAPAR